MSSSFADRPVEIVLNDVKCFEVVAGVTLLEALMAEGVAVPTACGGRGMCGCCKVRVVEGGAAFTDAELARLTDEERDAGWRLACQVRAEKPLRVEIPQELLAIADLECVCEANIELTRDIRMLRLRMVEPSSFSFAAGQFVQFRCPAYGDRDGGVYRAYSLASDPYVHDVIELIVRLAPDGVCTTYIFEYLREGDAVWINGPYGDFRLTETDAPILFIAGGSGMAPIKSMLHELVHRGSTRRATFFCGARDLNDLFLSDVMADFERKLPNFAFVPVVADPGDSGWKGATGLVTEGVERLAANVAESEAYLCGSPGMIGACVQLLTRMGMDEKNIFYDKFA